MGLKRSMPAKYVKPERQPFQYSRMDTSHIRMAVNLGSERTQAVEKDAPVVSEHYRRLVAALPCIHCGIYGHSQAAHADQGKGACIKSDDRTCFPLCCTRPGQQGCHDLIGATGAYTRDERRKLESEYGMRTRNMLAELNVWPAEVPTINEKPL